MGYYQTQRISVDINQRKCSVRSQIITEEDDNQSPSHQNARLMSQTIRTTKVNHLQKDAINNFLVMRT